MALLFVGVVIFGIAICIVICLCRRRCAKQRISEALQMENNYLHSAHQNNLASQTNTVALAPHNNSQPIINMKSVSMQNVAEISDDEEDEDELRDQTDKNTKSNAKVL